MEMLIERERQEEERDLGTHRDIKRERKKICKHTHTHTHTHIALGD